MQHGIALGCQCDCDSLEWPVLCWLTVNEAFEPLFPMKALPCPLTRVQPQAENARGCREAYSASDQPSSCAVSVSPTAPTTCPSLEAPAHGTKFGSKYFVGHEVHFTCSQGYHLVGSATRVCQDNGTWTGISAACKGESHWEFMVCWAQDTALFSCLISDCVGQVYFPPPFKHSSTAWLYDLGECFVPGLPCLCIVHCRAKIRTPI